MDTNIEIKIIDNESYGYLWRVIKESFLAAGKSFFTTDAPHPDEVGAGWALEYRWPHINRRIWFRLMQNGWKHHGLVFRSLLGEAFKPFSRPLVVTDIIRELKTTNVFEDYEYTEENGWSEIFPNNLLLGNFEFPYSKFFILNESSVEGQTVLANTNGESENIVIHYQVAVEEKPLGGQFEKE